MKVGQHIVIAMKNNGKDVDMAFFTCTKSGGLTDRLRQMTKVGDASADKIQLVLIDIPDNGGYYVYNEDVSDVNKAIAQFNEFYRAGALERQQLG